MNLRLSALAVLLLSVQIGSHVSAKAVPQAVREDSRVRVVRYDPNNVVEIPTSFGFATTVEFGQETIQTLSAGDTIGWQIVPKGNRLFIKPAEKPIPGMESTNITVITDKRNYYLHITTGSRKNPVFVVRFDYSRFGRPKTAPVVQKKEESVINRNYEVQVKKRNNNIDVRTVYDDGQFTYFEFNPKQPMPLIYLVNSDGREEMVNSRREGKYIVVEKVAQGFTLRLGKQYRCIRNRKKLNSGWF
ncbi:MAG: TrbG/VirB9 family P-type conjugative transfer protein [Neisseria animaloris]|nr:TrbG/VirB9 family P-type conjugative transfer protein [Neisseria animaloris]